jgi:hypothetical protein
MPRIDSGDLLKFGLALLLTCGCSGLPPLPAEAQTCTVQAGAAVPDTAFDQAFTQDGPGQIAPNGRIMERPNIPGWTGGDSMYSVYLPMTGETAFFFSDSYIGQAPPVAGDGTAFTSSTGLRTRAVNCTPAFGCYPATNLYRAHNSIVVRDFFGLTLRTIAGPAAAGGYAGSYFVPATAGHFYWVADSVLGVDQHGSPKVFTFLMEWDEFLNYYGAAIAQLSVPSLAIDSIQPIGNDPESDPVHWGVSAMLQPGPGGLTLYIYGIEDYVPSPAFSFVRYRMPHIARVNLGLGLAGMADESNWQVYNLASGWVPDVLSSSRLIGDTSDPNNANDSIGEMFTVNKIHSSVGTTYLLVSQDTNPNTTITVDNLPSPPDGPGPVFLYTAKDIVLYSACKPEGPFSAKGVVYSTPETDADTVPGMLSGQTLYGHLWTYGQGAHPQFTRDGELLISYSVNSDDSGDLIYADAYRPKFIRVPIAGLLPNFLIGR